MGSITHTRQATDGDDFSPGGKAAWNEGHTFSLSQSDITGLKSTDSPTFSRLLLTETTWADRPDATLWDGYIIAVSDIGVGGSFWRSDGTRWYPLNGQIMHAQIWTPTSVGATLSETELAAITIPAAAPGPLGMFYIDTKWATNNSANAKTLRVRFSGSAGTVYQQVNNANAVSVSMRCLIRNANAVNSQVGVGQVSISSYAFALTTADATSSVDTDAAATTISITGQKANVGDTITLQGVTVLQVTP